MEQVNLASFALKTSLRNRKAKILNATSSFRKLI